MITAILLLVLNGLVVIKKKNQIEVTKKFIKVGIYNGKL